MNLSIGSSGDAVSLLQTILIEDGYSVGSTGVDGQFGPNTQAAVKQFQTDHGLTSDGIVGAETASALGLDLSTGKIADAATSAITGGDTGSTGESTSSSRTIWYASAFGAAYFLKPWRWLGFGKK